MAGLRGLTTSGTKSQITSVTDHPPILFNQGMKRGAVSFFFLTLYQYILWEKFRTYHALVVEIRRRPRSEDGVGYHALQTHHVGQKSGLKGQKGLSYDK